MLSSPGIGSGLDVNSIVTKLMAVEARPLAQLTDQAKEVQAQVSAYGQLKGALSAFQSSLTQLNSLQKFKVLSATSSDEKVFTATASDVAVKGSYSLEVMRTAEIHRIASTTAVADTDTTRIGTAGDSMTITVGGSAFSVAYGDNTLAGIRDAINTAADNQGVTASIIKDDVGNRLVLSASDTGSSHALDVTYGTTDPFSLQTVNTDRDGSGGFTAVDLDAVVKLEGAFTATRSSNTVSDLIEGVTLSLTKAGTVTLAVDRDTVKVEASVQQFVKSYNVVAATITQLRGQASLRSDSAILVNVESQLRGLLNTPAELGGSFDVLAQVGITTTKAGTLELNQTVFKSALASDFDGVAKLFAHPDRGSVVRMKQTVDGFLGAGGFVGARTQSLNDQLKDIGDRQIQIEFRLTSVQQRLQKQFSALDGLVAQLQQTSSFLTQQLSSLPGFS